MGKIMIDKSGTKPAKKYAPNIIKPLISGTLNESLRSS